MSSDGNIYPEAHAPDNIVKEIKDLISAGVFKSGERLNQRKLAKRLGITTTPLREAFSKLERDGALKRINGIGVFVRKYSKDEIRDFYLMREVLEGLAARLCAERASEEEINRLEALGRSITKAIAERNLDKVRELEVAFHELIAACSGSVLLQEELRGALFIRTTIFKFTTLGIYTALEMESSHESIVAAIRARDCEAAENTIKKHIATGFRALLSNQKAHQNLRSRSGLKKHKHGNIRA